MEKLENANLNHTVVPNDNTTEKTGEKYLKCPNSHFER
jgi:hypothetical protein